MIKITNVKVWSDYSWNDIRNLTNWGTVKNTNSNWMWLNQSAIVGHIVYIETKIVENSWEGLIELYNNWDQIRNETLNWDSIKNI